MGKINNSRVKWKDMTDEYLTSIAIKFWNIYRNDYNCPWIVCMATDYFIRRMTDHIGKKKSLISKEALKSNSKCDHHFFEVEEFFDEWKNCIENDKEFTIEDAKTWLNKSQNIILTNEEHDLVHRNEFIECKKNDTFSIIELFKKFDIELVEYMK